MTPASAPDEPVRFLGVDLAWGSRRHGSSPGAPRTRPTGLAEVVEGRLVATALAGDDHEVLAWLSPRSTGPCIVAFDAPLVVVNPTGRRPCEAAIDHCFRRFQAGCHPTNTGLVHPRAAGLAAALDLDLDPRFAPGSAVRTAIEVYPHAATVALFGLDRTLKYKPGRGRDLASRRAALRRLVALVAGLAEGDPPLDVAGSGSWQRLATGVDGAVSGAALDRAADEIDAVVCAYVAFQRWTTGDRASRVVGDPVTGAIVVPVTPVLAACLDAAVGVDRAQPGGSNAGTPG